MEHSFGSGQESHLPAKLSAYGKKILLTYGGGSIKKTGLYDKLMDLLKDFEIFELGGIAPNPKIESVNTGAAICKKEGIDVILAVGGGSTIDCSKAIAAAAYYDGDAWDLLLDMSKITKALPIAVVLTIAATGSEMDSVAVISNMRTNEKLPLYSPLILPKVSVLNPENTYTVPPFQTAAGSADIMSHVIENYFDREQAFVPDALNEGLLRAVIKYTPIALKQPSSYEARAQLMWASTLALNGLGSTGKTFAWSCHYIEHELSAFYDITHGAGLAVLTPKWMRHILSEDTVDKFCDYAVNVWGLERGNDKFTLANQGIDATEAFFKSIGLPSTLAEFGIDNTHFELMAKNAVKIGGLRNAYVPLSEKDVVTILQMSL
ncbi:MULTISPECIES: iron-containing alcohol dehydrogenase [unclassified Desulfovibrio]|uniref:iron-containing alcohol dehydrogenase n=1 Tax=unclassified Desulfovibrio TaxID=2593640 RepID=UPI000F5E6438|nr:MULTISPECIES: iron-containing alcohol dehydrogenase [unclassified Desulfovibrio]RRD69111.1 iron-containing alcohol dehydrogenase [Desulfovibrio sp. OH1209_COT-279]RRD85456.1 iron-containing alcohol dehydrogenase [Desulfovibrio sp. OH1186_COT-070]